MDLIHIKLPKTDLYLTKDEIYQLLRNEKDIYKKAIQRGKNIKRAKRLD